MNPRKTSQRLAGMAAARIRRAPAALLLVAATAFAAGTAGAQETPGAGGELSLDIYVIAKRLDIAREQIEPSLGASTYEFNQQAIQNQPQGYNAPLNQVLLQAPGVAQDSFGQLHVRGDHANLQYRLNGVELPEGINVFGQALETRLAQSVTLITGALPAQYGFRTAGIIDIETKTGTLAPSGDVTMYGGSHSTLQPSAELGGVVGRLDYYATGEYLHNSVGIENPTLKYDALHDLTDQGRGFLYLAGIIDPTTRLSAILGTSRSQFQIPNNENQIPRLGLTVDGIANFNSVDLNENQRQITHYGIATLQKQIDALDFQISGFTRYSSLFFTPDPLGDLLFNGIAETAYRRSIATGTQGDGSWRVAPAHTLRAGFLVQAERSSGATVSSVLPVDANGIQTSDQPLSIIDQTGKTGWLYGVHLQDEWQVIPTLTVNFGARFDIVDEYTHERQLSPRLNAVWRPAPTTVLHAGYARYFTPPPFELVAPRTIALFANTTGAPAVALDIPVKSDRSHYFDLGGTQILLPGLKLGIDAYYKISHDLIDEGQFGAPIILTPFNYEKGLVKGAELTLNYDFRRLSFWGNFAVNKALGKNIISGQFNFAPDELAYIADHYIHLDHDQTYTASSGIAYTFPTRTRVSLDLIHGSGLRASSEFPNSESLPSYNQVNFSVVQRVDTGFLAGLELRLDVINLFDEKYQIRNGTGVGVGPPQFGPRRTVFAGLTQRF